MGLRHDVRIDPHPASLAVAEPSYGEKVDVLVTWAGGRRVDMDLLRVLPNLGLVATYGIGTDHLDLDALQHRHVALVTTRGAVERPTAEVAIGLMLSVRRRLVEGHEIVRAGEWPIGGVEGLLGHGLEGSTIGIVGLGRIGHTVAQIGGALGMYVLYSQRHRASPAIERSCRATYLALPQLLARSDVVTLHCPLTEETRHLIDRSALASMRTSSILVNTSRGAVVDESALVDALERGVIAGAGLDVYEAEPSVHPGLLRLSNVVLSPHLGSATFEARHAMTAIVVEAIEHYASVKFSESIGTP
jgi:glyoxylate reductase